MSPKYNMYVQMSWKIEEKEINSLKRKLTSLEKQKLKLIEEQK